MKNKKHGSFVNQEKLKHLKKNNPKTLMIKNTTVRNHCQCTDRCRCAAHSICNLRRKISKEIPVELCDISVKNAGKCIIFSVPLKKEIENRNTRAYKIKCIDNTKNITNSL